uniref:Uncharacterized protein n=1 Tax=Timema bartmani TaxID=61472 RepID=A0A7R9EVZ4_9NEOP|nr:unnamed protein product [Timema bartmani]
MTHFYHSIADCYNTCELGLYHRMTHKSSLIMVGAQEMAGLVIIIIILILTALIEARWKPGKKATKDDERRGIVQKAGDIIREDIRLRAYYVDNYTVRGTLNNYEDVPDFIASFIARIFMGAVVYFMSGTGLEDLLSTVYVRPSVIHMISEHAFTREFRAHSIIQLALVKLLLQRCKDFNSFKEDMEILKAGLLNGAISATEAVKADVTTRILKIFHEMHDQKGVETGPYTFLMSVPYYRIYTLQVLFTTQNQHAFI